VRDLEMSFMTCKNYCFTSHKTWHKRRDDGLWIHSADHLQYILQSQNTKVMIPFVRRVLWLGEGCKCVKRWHSIILRVWSCKVTKL